MPFICTKIAEVTNYGKKTEVVFKRYCNTIVNTQS